MTSPTMPRQLQSLEARNGLKHSAPAVLPKLATEDMPSNKINSDTILAQVSTTSDTLALFSKLMESFKTISALGH